jgi:hypothetical protein
VGPRHCRRRQSELKLPHYNNLSGQNKKNGISQNTVPVIKSGRLNVHVNRIVSEIKKMFLKLEISFMLL